MPYVGVAPQVPDGGAAEGRVSLPPATTWPVSTVGNSLLFEAFAFPERLGGEEVG